MTVSEHHFHITVMGTGFSADTPIRVAHFGISSVISIVDDLLLEKIREHYHRMFEMPYTRIHRHEEHGRSRRITAYLDTVQEIVRRKIEAVRQLSFGAENDKSKYFDLLPDDSALKVKFMTWTETIDDFGIGYSSLSYLHRFPIDILKIDRSFVGRLTEQGDGPELARAIVLLGETLGLETVAEGVEQEEQARELLELGCVAAQGFLFARSSPLDAVSAMPFAARRAELPRSQALSERLTATGRFNVAGMVRTRSVA